MTLLQKYNAVQKIGNIEAPYVVWTRLGLSKTISINGDQICLANESDFCSVEEAQEAVQWLVEQLGGKVKWTKEAETTKAAK